ncbi:MAG: flavodoxin [Candidatus Thermoplasmatota archaeon]
MKTLLVYYSQTGNTEKVAKMLAKKLENEGIDLKTVFIERSRERSYEENVEDAKKEARAEIEPVIKNLSEFEILFIGTPVWCGKPATPVNAFMEKCERLDGTKIIPFLTHGGGGPGMTFDKIRDELEPKGGNVVEELALSSKEVDSKTGKGKVEDLVSRLV